MNTFWLHIDADGRPLGLYPQKIFKLQEPIPTEFDFIHAFTGYYIPQVLWQKFSLKIEVIKKLTKN